MSVLVPIPPEALESEKITIFIPIAFLKNMIKILEEIGRHIHKINHSNIKNSGEIC